MFWYRTMCYEMMVCNPNSVEKAIPYTGLKMMIVKTYLKFIIKLEMWGHGIGRHDDKEIWSIAVNDLNAISTFLS